jgi:hypothetical protein
VHWVSQCLLRCQLAYLSEALPKSLTVRSLDDRRSDSSGFSRRSVCGYRSSVNDLSSRPADVGDPDLGHPCHRACSTAQDRASSAICSQPFWAGSARSRGIPFSGTAPYPSATERNPDASSRPLRVHKTTRWTWARGTACVANERPETTWTRGFESHGGHPMVARTGPLGRNPSAGGPRASS